jgi:hypothetical protein
MLARKRVVFGDAFHICGFRVDATLAQTLRHIRNPHPSARERKSIVHEHSITASRQFIGPRNAAVILFLMSSLYRPGVVVGTSNLAPAHELVAAMIVQGKNSRQATLCSGRLQKDRLSSRPARQLPREVLDMQTIVSGL